MKFTHGEYEINMDEGTGVFHFVIDGVNKVSTSLIGAKRSINSASKKAFVPFSALVPRYAAPGYIVVKAIGKKLGIKRKYRTDMAVWLTTGGSYAFVYANTPENRAALTAAWTLEREGNKAVRDLQDANLKAYTGAMAAATILRPGESK